jgi:hypothetical protein
MAGLGWAVAWSYSLAAVFLVAGCGMLSLSLSLSLCVSLSLCLSACSFSTRTPLPHHCFVIWPYTGFSNSIARFFIELDFYTGFQEFKVDPTEPSNVSVWK